MNTTQCPVRTFLSTRKGYDFATRVALKCARDHRTRDDFAQDAITRVLERAEMYDPSQALEPWISTVIRNSVRNGMASEAKRSCLPLDMTGQRSDDDKRPGVTKADESETLRAYARLELAALERALAVLRPAERAYTEARLDGAGNGEASQAAGRSDAWGSINWPKIRAKLERAM